MNVILKRIMDERALPMELTERKRVVLFRAIDKIPVSRVEFRCPCNWVNVICLFGEPYYGTCGGCGRQVVVAQDKAAWILAVDGTQGIRQAKAK